MVTTVPLYRALSKLGYTSRTQAITMIKNGEISVDGAVCLDPQRHISLQISKITHDNQRIEQGDLIVIMLYKPKSIITSRKDEQNRPTIYSLLPQDYHHLHCVGRLDYATSGLLLLTNNTQLSSWLTDPKSGIPRVYLVSVRGMVTPQTADLMNAGVAERGEILKSQSAIIRKASRKESHLVLTLSEGKNREIRRLCKSLGHEVTKLKRVAYGPLTLGTMSPGEHRILSNDELYTAFPDARSA